MCDNESHFYKSQPSVSSWRRFRTEDDLCVCKTPKKPEPLSLDFIMEICIQLDNLYKGLLIGRVPY